VSFGQDKPQDISINQQNQEQYHLVTAKLKPHTKNVLKDYKAKLEMELA